jgi:UDP-N-acetylmuramate dehydrogenase
MVFPESEAQFIQAAKLLHTAGITPLLIGNGSNLLAHDAPIDRIAVKTQDGVARLEQVDATTVYASAGVRLARIATFARDEGLCGFAFAHGIPGTLGGAIFMNAGAYGGEMAQVVTRVHYLDETLTRQVCDADACAFAYRHSRFMDTKELILGAEITLTPGNPADISAQMAELAEKRRASQPLDLPSGGSTFKRPKTGYAAAMIDEAGLKGYTVGEAMVSEKHAGFVVNRGGATCADVLAVMAHVQETVFQRTGVRLEPEVEFIT